MAIVSKVDLSEESDRPTIPIEDAARICGCSSDDLRRWRKQVLPRSGGSLGDPDMFRIPEVVAMAAGAAAKTWKVKANLDQLIARLALRGGDERDWVLVYESRKGLRIEPTPFTLELWGTKKGRIYDPAPCYEALDDTVTN